MAHPVVLERCVPKIWRFGYCGSGTVADGGNQIAQEEESHVAGSALMKSKTARTQSSRENRGVGSECLGPQSTRRQKDVKADVQSISVLVMVSRFVLDPVDLESARTRMHNHLRTWIT